MTKETGGSAFPAKIMTAMVPHDIPKEWLDKIQYVQQDNAGMTLRDYFASDALRGIIPCMYSYEMQNREVIAQEAFAIADAMLKARDK